MTISTLNILILIILVSCACSSGENSSISWYPKIDVSILSNSQNADFISDLRAYQQTTEYTCGPAALLSFAKFYGYNDILEDTKTEMRIAQELGTRDLNSSQPGTKPEEMVVWLEKNGFDARLEFEDKGDGSALQQLRDNIRRGIPTLVEWIDLSGHWAIAVDTIIEMSAILGMMS